MKFFRKKIVARSFAIFTLLTILNSLVPNISYGLTSGPHQPEFTSYEGSDATDMVNLLTGDFAYNMPVLSVPSGNEGAFSIPLSYHAGIGLDQEASWVGLGWNINVGSITRGINGFPDDASGESQTVNVKDPGRRGWSSSFAGSAIGWDSEMGHYGTIQLSTTLNFGYNDGKISSVGLMGFTLKGGDVTFNAKEFAVIVITVVANILTYGASAIISETASVAVQIAMEVGANAIAAAAMPDQTPGLGTQGYWKFSKKTDKDLFHTDYWIWLDKTRVEDMYGTLNLDKASQFSDPDTDMEHHNFFRDLKKSINTVDAPMKRFPKSQSAKNKGAASDINIDLSGSEAYKDNTSPTMLAYDNFQVNGPGISGSIKPYRMEVGSVAAPREMSTKHRRLNPVPYIDYGTAKVPFVYEGDIGNRYFHHVGSTSTVTTPTPNYGTTSTTETGAIRYNYTDATFDSERVRADANTAKRIPKGNHVEWLTNNEIKTTTGKFASGFVDYFKGIDRTNFRNAYSFGGRATIYGTSATNGTISLAPNQNVSSLTNNSYVDVILVTEYLDADGDVIYTSTSAPYNVQVNSFNSTQIVVNSPISHSAANGRIEIISKSEPKPAQAIGGYVITSAEGMNYHYALPVYDYDFKTYTVNKNDAGKNSTITRFGQFANTWLLTAITGPDYVDRGGTNNQGDGYIDTDDWGYWVKFNYGSHVTDFKWRTPYADGTYKRSSDDAVNTYAEGFKEKYYLNTVETRSHVAMFIKDTRTDAKDALTTGKKTSLKLGEIALLTRDAYKQLTNSGGSYQLADASNTVNVCYQYTRSGYASNSINGTKLSFVEANALRRIKFNTDYSLCNGTPNTDANGGKLTLKSISILSRNNVKVLPDFKFSYGSNPAFQADKWDGWGMYSSTGTSTGTSHATSSTPMDGAAWSLTSVTSPLGHVMAVQYERDTYSSISGNALFGNSSSYAGGDYSTNTSDPNLHQLRVPTPSQYVVGEKVKVSGSVSWMCAGNFPPSYSYTSSGTSNSSYAGEYTVSSVSSTGITLSGLTLISYCSSGVNVTINNQFSIAKAIAKSGGNLRVASITLSDYWGKNSKIRYQYDDNGISTGVVSVEPDYIRTLSTEYDFNNWIGYPTTPVLYGKVSVLTGKLTSDADYHTRTVYEFQTPHKSMYTRNTDMTIKNKVKITDITVPAFGTYEEWTSLYKHEIQRRTSKIGKLISIKTYDNVTPTVPISTQSYTYTENLLNENGVSNQGVYSEGTLMTEIVGTEHTRYHKSERTTLVDYPYVLSKIVTTVDGLSSEQENIKWDLYTGIPVETRTKSPSGFRTRTIATPVYRSTGTGYAELGSKADNLSNKNMLTQIASSYTYRLNAAGSDVGLIGAFATTWKKDWSNYRKLTGSDYSDNAETDLDGNGTATAAELQATQIWRKNGSYVWKGDQARLNQDGTHKFTSPTDKFNFSSPDLTKWQFTGSFERFDHNSNLLESKDLKGLYASIKLGYNNSLQLASAANAQYVEMAFSSAEDRIGTTSFFGGEVGLGSGSVVTTPVHTGKSALQLATNAYGFIYRNTSGTMVNKVYKSSVWSTSANGRIYYKLSGGAAVVPPNQVISPAIRINGTLWYRIDAIISVGATSLVEVGVQSVNTTAVFDDFRFQPFQGTLTGYVYDPSTYNLEFVLGNDNTFTRYEYNDRGVVVKVYQESITYSEASRLGNEVDGQKLVSESKDDYRRFHVDQ